MDMNLNLGYHLKLDQNLSPQMLQSIQILQMNSLDLEMAIKQELEVNPLLEVVDSVEIEEQNTTEDSENSSVEDDFVDENHDLIDSINEKEIDWDKFVEDGFESDHLPKDLNHPDPDDENYRREVTEQQSLQDYLRNQLRDWKRPLRIVTIVEYLIDCVNENGFLETKETEFVSGFNELENKNPDIREAEAVLQNQKELKEASLVVQEAFHVLQSFSPPGIGARNLRECFLIQAYRIPDFSPTAIEILENHFEALKSLHYGVIAKALNISTDDVQKAVHELSKLSPHPGTQIDHSPVRLIVPDMEVIEESPGVFKAVMKENSLPRLRINREYQKLLHRKSTSKSDKEYIRNQFNNANNYIKSIENRQNTMLSVMQAIVDRQYDFFEKGPEYLKPMILQDIADAVQRDSSTVNRVTNGKYVETPHGIYELKRFFTSKVLQKDGSEMSSARIQKELRNLIEVENPEKPLSDQTLVNLLAGKGIQVARRTIAKYREDLGILPARIRRKKVSD